MQIADTMFISVRCSQCRAVEAITLGAEKDDSGRLVQMGKSHWPKTCHKCGMVAALPCTELDYEDPDVAMRAEVAIRQRMRESRA